MEDSVKIAIAKMDAMIAAIDVIQDAVLHIQVGNKALAERITALEADVAQRKDTPR